MSAWSLSTSGLAGGKGKPGIADTSASRTPAAAEEDAAVADAALALADDAAADTARCATSVFAPCSSAWLTWNDEAAPETGAARVRRGTGAPP